MKQYSVDRLEGDLAILIDDQNTITEILKKLLPDDTKEGDILIQVGAEYKKENGYTENKRKESAELIDQLFE